MKRLRTVGLAGAVAALVGCGGVETCDEPEFYESAVEGKRIEVPGDLNGLAANKELAIPEPSPRAPRPPGSGCLDRPPTLNIDNKDDKES